MSPSIALESSRRRIGALIASSLIVLAVFGGVFQEPNGIWTYSMGAISGLLAPPSGETVPVRGASAPVGVDFSPPQAPPPAMYLVTILETGLALGVTWSVQVASTSYSTTGTLVAFTEPNNTYAFTVGSVAGYSVAPRLGSIIVSGSATSQLLTFTPHDGWLNGTVSPSSAMLRIDGVAVSLTGGAFSSSLAPGTHTVEATESGYAPYYNNVTIVAGTAAPPLPIRLTAVTVVSGSSSTNGLTTIQLAELVLGLIVLAMAILVTGLMMRDRRSGTSESGVSSEDTSHERSDSVPSALSEKQ